MTEIAATTNNLLGIAGLAKLIEDFGPREAPEVVFIRDFEQVTPKFPSEQIPFMLRPVAVDLNGEVIRNMGLAYPWEIARWAVYCEQQEIAWQKVAWLYKREAKTPILDDDGNPTGRFRRGKLVFELAK